MIAKLLPPKVRQAIYVLLGTALALEAVWDLVPAGTESRLVATAAALGFVLAGTHVPTGPGDD